MSDSELEDELIGLEEEHAYHEDQVMRIEWEIKELKERLNG